MRKPKSKRPRCLLCGALFDKVEDGWFHICDVAKPKSSEKPSWLFPVDLWSREAV